MKKSNQKIPTHYSSAIPFLALKNSELQTFLIIHLFSLQLLSISIGKFDDKKPKYRPSASYYAHHLKPLLAQIRAIQLRSLAYGFVYLK